MLTIENLEVRYGAVQAVKGVSLELRQGETVAVIGANGAGKSSLMQAVAGLVKPATGRIIYDGKAIGGWPAHRVSNAGISLVPERREVFGSLTVTENLRMGLKTAIGKVRGAAFEQELQRAFDRFPRLEERRNQLAYTLSGGEQQMLVLSRALMSKPKLLLLDEPSLGLAPIIVAELFTAIEGLKQEGVTILLVEQLAHKALAAADRGYVLENGHLVMEGPAHKLMEDKRMIQAYLGAS
ncbi:ABC transporter ATP-binding protein [Paenibacillus sp. GCM10023252]|uniref:ABC transporter ATP-binding protein n=1 Tax=Paenibacillus sp. GCM10023252 TaxID=3252649 RepID=UPI003610B00D